MLTRSMSHPVAFTAEEYEVASILTSMRNAAAAPALIPVPAFRELRPRSHQRIPRLSVLRTYAPAEFASFLRRLHDMELVILHRRNQNTLASEARLTDEQQSILTAAYQRRLN